VSPDASDEQVNDLHAQVDAIVQRMGAQLEKTENWGRRKLAYEIGRHKEGTYVLELIVGNGDVMKEIDRRLKVSDLVIRHLVVRIDEEQGVVERMRSRRTETSRRRRVARGLPAERQPGEGQRGEPDEDRDERFDIGAEDMR
jgi:small subunit ribosomal protein S6